LTWAGEPAGDVSIADVAGTDDAGEGTLTFIASKAYASRAGTLAASACVITAELLPAAHAQVPTHFLLTPSPERVFAALASQFYPAAGLPAKTVAAGASEVHASAVVDPTALLEDGVKIAAGAVIGAGAEIGAGTEIGANTCVGPGVTIGRNCRIGAQCVLHYAHLGDRVLIQPAVVIGGDGFGYASSPEGHAKIPQLGRVIIQDEVEIGALTAVDRGALSDTVIGEGTKIDNHVQIAHNCRVGRHCLLAGHVALAGSTVLEDFVVMGGQAAAAGHITIGAGALMAARSATNRDLPGGQAYGGAPARPIAEWKREVVALSRLAKRPKKS
ncbi:MAG: UDP-3-O-(3-hydroxymyristoyl)glucosamine N-acyltransferase, partial [Pseudomonadota bacterium]